MSRVLALDYGERRIGVAVSDPTRTIAQPLPTIVRRRGRRPPYTKIIEAITEWDAELVVLGLPIETSGEEGAPAQAVRSFGEGLGQRAGVPIEYWDERFTSVRAQRELSHLDLPASARRQKERVDAMAATLILQSYLDGQRGS
ncbi:MAG: Holliday junction resolvase RuvX [Gemmatimonadota bacterium]|nr:MAG: Holliday junction resolvase RuvX [Gemmatimonadota bacterium]